MPAYLAQRRHVAAGQVGQEVVLRLTQQLKRGRQMVVLLHAQRIGYDKQLVSSRV